MASPVSLSFRSAPSIVPSYLRVVFHKKVPLLPKDTTLPRLEAVLARFQAKRERVDAYRAVCGGESSDTLPVAYPHVLAMPVQLALMSSSAFPVRLMGLVHLRNHIEQRRPLRVGEVGRLRVWIEGHRETNVGQEFDVNTSVEIDGQPVWQETCVFMARRMTREKRYAGRIAAGEGIPAPDAESVQPDSPESVRTMSFEADEGIGWRYARVSSDFNPIHLSKLGARMFGFNQPIAHGMWSMARCLAALNSDTFAGAKRVDVVFKRPVTIPAPLTLETWHTQNGAGFALKGTDRGKMHVAGSVVPLAATRR
ncbi:MAG TPA: MaoC/PaaZ C-terminal domain-containing protein [Steroidobacteraceae bacterium]|nr:MaoC/PaaZ C-terminal domain-containing protein [Steroidobacteraceae bacterium]